MSFLQALFDSVTPSILLAGVAIFFARIVDVSFGAVRTISLVQGRMALAFWAGFVEVVVWLVVLTNTLGQVAEKPLLGVFYAFGYASGNVVGIWVEKKIAMGKVAVRVFCARDGGQTAEALRALGQPVTLYAGVGRDGPVTELYIVADRRDIKPLLAAINRHAPQSFYTVEAVMRVNEPPPSVAISPSEH